MGYVTSYEVVYPIFIVGTTRFPGSILSLDCVDGWDSYLFRVTIVSRILIRLFNYPLYLLCINLIK